MFEKYTEKARRCIFFARFEASRLGRHEIDTEHLLLGILREDAELASRLAGPTQNIEMIREKVEKLYTVREKVSISVDLPVSKPCQHVMERATEEAERYQHKHIAPAHLLLGIVSEEDSLAARILGESGITSTKVRSEVARSASPPEISRQPEEAGSAASGVRDLTAAARNGELSRLIGRERELERAIQILCRRNKNNPVLVGEPGVGKTALIQGLAQWIADGAVPIALADRPILVMDAGLLVARRRGTLTGEHLEATLAEASRHVNPILCIEGLFDLAASSGWPVIEAMHVLEPRLSLGRFQCIATGTPEGLRQTMEKAKMLARQFEIVELLPPVEDEAIRILAGLKEQYEKFHGVVFAEGAIEAAVYASARFLRHRQLPDRALDLLDEAGARVQVRREQEPPEIVKARQRIRTLNRQMENAIGRHEFPEARRYEEEESQERQSLQRLRQEHPQEDAPASVTPEDIAAAVADRAGVPVSAVTSLMQEKEAGRFARISRELAAQVPVESRGWIPFLAAYLGRCSAEDAAKLADAIRQVSLTP